MPVELVRASALADSAPYAYAAVVGDLVLTAGACPLDEHRRRGLPRRRGRAGAPGDGEPRGRSRGRRLLARRRREVDGVRRLRRPRRPRRPPGRWCARRSATTTPRAPSSASPPSATPTSSSRSKPSPPARRPRWSSSPRGTTLESSPRDEPLVGRAAREERAGRDPRRSSSPRGTSGDPRWSSSPRGTSGRVETPAAARRPSPQTLSTTSLAGYRTCVRVNQGMTAVLDLHPDTGHPAVAGVREIHDLLDTLLDDLLNDVDLRAAALGRVRRPGRRLRPRGDPAAGAEAETARGGRQGRGRPGRRPARHRRLAGPHTRAGGADAAREVRLATALDDDLPATAAALAAGDGVPRARHRDRGRRLPAARVPVGRGPRARRAGPGRQGDAAGPGPAPPGRPAGPGGRRARRRRGRRPRGRAAARGGDRRPGAGPGSPCTTTTTAPCPATSPSPPWPAPSSARPSNSSPPRAAADPPAPTRPGLGPPAGRGVRRAPRTPAHRPPPRQGRRHRRRHPRPRQAPRPGRRRRPRHRRPDLRGRDPPPRLQRRPPARRPGRRLPGPRPRPHPTPLHRGPTHRPRHPPHHLRRRRLRPPVRLVRAPPPTPWSHGGRTDLQDAIPLCGYHHRRIHLRI